MGRSMKSVEGRLCPDKRKKRTDLTSGDRRNAPLEPRFFDQTDPDGDIAVLPTVPMWQLLALANGVEGVAVGVVVEAGEAVAEVVDVAGDLGAGGDLDGGAVVVVVVAGGDAIGDAVVVGVGAVGGELVAVGVARGRIAIVVGLDGLGHPPGVVIDHAALDVPGVDALAAFGVPRLLPILTSLLYNPPDEFRHPIPT